MWRRAVRDTKRVELGKRQQQIYETVLRLGSATVAQVCQNMAEAPSYSSVRTMLGILVDKGHLKVIEQGKRYVYTAAHAKQRVQQNAVRRLLDVFFGGSSTSAVAAILDLERDGITEEQATQLREMISEARKRV
jgi:BlaI family transcriptional regulator, penicillinase repressor